MIREFGIETAIDLLERIGNQNMSGPIREFSLYLRGRHIGAIRNRYDPATKRPWKAVKFHRGSGRRVTRNDVTTLEKSLYVTTTASSVTVGYSTPIAYYRQEQRTIPARTIRARNKKALYWNGASHPVKEVRQPSFVVPARPALGYNEGDLRYFEEIVGNSVLG